jgi:DNA invertase Pin-like site-specific DNA recombinase
MINMDKTVQKHCLMYFRVSSSKQAQQGESFEDQEKVCENIAKMRNAIILGVYKEQYSGRKDERPAIEEMISFIKKNPNKIDFIIFKSIDRFTRNGTLGYESLKQRLAQYGVELVDANGIIQPSKNTLEHLGVEYNWSRIHPRSRFS